MNVNERFNNLNKIFVKEEYFSRMINTYATNVKVNDLSKKVDKCALNDIVDKTCKSLNMKIDSMNLRMTEDFVTADAFRTLLNDRINKVNQEFISK